MNELYNSEAIAIVSTIEIMKKLKCVSNAKFLLIFPLISNDELIKYLGRAKIRSLEDLLIKRGTLISNFNSIYKELLPVSINMLTILCEAKILEHIEGQITYIGDDVSFKSIESKRFKRIMKATENISSILEESVEKLYLQLKVII